VTLRHKTVTLALSEDAQSALERMALPAERPLVTAWVEETDDLGVWIRVDRPSGRHVLLVRWEYVLSVDFPLEETPPIGLKG
jgi:hypothetical protein